MNRINLFLDSGAFSAWNQNIEIDLDEYIAFVKEHEDIIGVYANLDSIGDPQKTWQNQRAMERAGLNPLPCFHYGEPIEYLERYLDRYDYVALGGMVPISTKDLSVWLDSLFSEYLTDEDGMPSVKVHGFGLTSLPLMLRYPWYSVDSTSWVLTSRMGSIYVPCRRGGKWIYEQSWKVAVSSRSPAKKEAGQHLCSFSHLERKIILQYVEEKGFVLGSSDFRMEADDYVLEENERWFGKPKNGKREVEVIIEPGISNDYRLRDQLNVVYFLDLERSMPKWPWR